MHVYLFFTDTCLCEGSVCESMYGLIRVYVICEYMYMSMCVHVCNAFVLFLSKLVCLGRPNECV